MYSKKTSLLIAFHGCDKSIRDAVVNGTDLKPSCNDYDWLGNGLYFWESDPTRAYEWALQLSQNPKSSIKEPSVLGAVIDLGNCLDLTNRSSIKLLQLSYQWLKESCQLNGDELPKNINVGNNRDLLLRKLDCAVIQMLHTRIASNSDLGLTPYDSVRGVFIEGNPIYEGAGFMEKTHIQLCIINPNCIKGYFMPREINEKYPEP